MMSTELSLVGTVDGCFKAIAVGYPARISCKGEVLIGLEMGSVIFGQEDSKGLPRKK